MFGALFGYLGNHFLFYGKTYTFRQSQNGDLSTDAVSDIPQYCGTRIVCK
jgi:hypothetical protein